MEEIARCGRHDAPCIVCRSARSRDGVPAWVQMGEKDTPVTGANRIPGIGVRVGSLALPVVIHVGVLFDVPGAGSVRGAPTLYNQQKTRPTCANPFYSTVFVRDRDGERPRTRVLAEHHRAERGDGPFSEARVPPSSALRAPSPRRGEGDSAGPRRASRLSRGVRAVALAPPVSDFFGAIDWTASGKRLGSFRPRPPPRV